MTSLCLSHRLVHATPRVRAGPNAPAALVTILYHGDTALQPHLPQQPWSVWVFPTSTAPQLGLGQIQELKQNALRAQQVPAKAMGWAESFRNLSLPQTTGTLLNL